MTTEIRPGKKLCHCAICRDEMEKGFTALHLDSYGMKLTFCLECCVDLGNDARKELDKNSIMVKTIKKGGRI
jgi:hypothetical protein